MKRNPVPPGNEEQPAPLISPTGTAEGQRELEKVAEKALVKIKEGHSHKPGQPIRSEFTRAIIRAALYEITNKEKKANSAAPASTQEEEK